MVSPNHFFGNQSCQFQLHICGTFPPVRVCGPQVGWEVGRNTEMKKTGIVADRLTSHPQPLGRNSWGNPKDRPHAKDQHHSHKMEEWEDRGWRRPPPPKRREEMTGTGKATPKENVKTQISNKQTKNPQFLNCFIHFFSFSLPLLPRVPTSGEAYLT